MVREDLESGKGLRSQSRITHDQIIKLKDCRKSVTFGINKELKKRRHCEEGEELHLATVDANTVGCFRE